MTDDIKEYKKRNVLTNRLNAAIHNRNLFCAGRRYIEAKNEGGKVTVRDLYTNERIAFVNDGSFTDCNGSKVIIEGKGTP